MLLSPFEYARRVEKQREQLYRVAFCYVKNSQEALDIVSESVYRGLIRLHQLREPARFDAWMKRIVIHTALDHLRKGGSYTLCSEEHLPELPADESALTAEDTLDLYNALDTLAPEERSFIILRFFEEYSYREIAETLQMPESTVKSKLYRILEKLRKQLTN